MDRKKITRRALALTIIAFGGLAPLVGCDSIASQDDSAGVTRNGGKGDDPNAPNRGLMTDEGTRRLAEILAGHSLQCDASDKAGAKTEERGFFPLTVTASPATNGTWLEVETNDRNVGFGFGGSGFDETEVGKSWIIVSQGDDGRRHLMVQHYPGFVDDAKCFASADTSLGPDYELPGTVMEIWDAGSITSRGVQCCVR